MTDDRQGGDGLKRGMLGEGQLVVGVLGTCGGRHAMRGDVSQGVKGSARRQL